MEAYIIFPFYSLQKYQIQLKSIDWGKFDWNGEKKATRLKEVSAKETTNF